MWHLVLFDIWYEVLFIGFCMRCRFGFGMRWGLRFSIGYGRMLLFGFCIMCRIGFGQGFQLMGDTALWVAFISL